MSVKNPVSKLNPFSRSFSKLKYIIHTFANFNRKVTSYWFLLSSLIIIYLFTYFKYTYEVLDSFVCTRMCLFFTKGSFALFCIITNNISYLFVNTLIYVCLKCVLWDSFEIIKTDSFCKSKVGLPISSQLIYQNHFYVISAFKFINLNSTWHCIGGINRGPLAQLKANKPINQLINSKYSIHIFYLKNNTLLKT